MEEVKRFEIELHVISGFGIGFSIIKHEEIIMADIIIAFVQLSLTFNSKANG